MKPIGLLESFELSESVGDKALTMDELLFMAKARQKKGCRNFKSKLIADDRMQVMALGLKCKLWKEGNQ